MPERSGPDTYTRRPLRWGTEEVYGLAPVQLHTGGLFDGEPHGATPIHLVRSTATAGTPGALICGLDHHTLPLGFSVRRGVSSPALGDADPATAPCRVCVLVAARMALGVEQLRVADGVGTERMVRAIADELERMGVSESASVTAYDSWRASDEAFKARRRLAERALEEVGDAR